MTALDVLPDAAFLDRLADAADAATLPLFRAALDVSAKQSARGDFDPVTEADRAAERAMRRLIEREFPTHGIVGEEYGPRDAQARAVWWLDPIDGTRQFVAGMPLWGSMAGLALDGRPTFGLVSQPFTRERFFGLPGRGLHRGPDGERPLRTRACGRLADAVLFTTSPHHYVGAKGEAFEALRGEARLVRYGIDCYAFCLLALGFVDVAMETGVQAYDILPLVPIVEAAGGAVVDWHGRPVAGGGDVLAVGDRRMLDVILPMLA